MRSVNNIEEKVFSYVKENKMILENDELVVGVSGGADSVCLLFVLCRIKEKLPIKLHVCHINHGIREEAHVDAEYVEDLCRKLDIPFTLEEIDVKEYAKINKLTEEEAGRILRYRSFNKIADDITQNGKCAKIAVAHNMNDRSETLLFNLFRGSGQKGFGSIRPVRDNIIRPILCLTRAEIEEYLNAQGISFCQDKTNFENEYSRNKIRNIILPFVEKEIVEGATVNLSRAAQAAAEVEDYLKLQTKKAIGQCLSGSKLLLEEFEKEEPLIQKRILYYLVTQKANSAKDITSSHISDILKLTKTSGSHRLSLPYGLCAIKEYDSLEIKGQKEIDIPDINGETDFLEIEVAVRWSEEATIINLPEGKVRISYIKYQGESDQIPTNQYTKWFDYDKIEKSLSIRTRRTGDYFSIASGENQLIHKSLKDYMINKKIPKYERDKKLLISEGSHILWLLGERISEYYKIGDNTSRILQIEYFCDR